MGGVKSFRNPDLHSLGARYSRGKTKAQRATKPALSDALAPAFLEVTHAPKNECFFQESNAELSGGAAVRLSAGLCLDFIFNLYLSCCIRFSEINRCTTGAPLNGELDVK